MSDMINMMFNILLKIISSKIKIVRYQCKKFYKTDKTGRIPVQPSIYIKKNKLYKIKSFPYSKNQSN